MFKQIENKPESRECSICAEMKGALYFETLSNDGLDVCQTPFNLTSPSPFMLDRYVYTWLIVRTTTLNQMQHTHILTHIKTYTHSFT